MLFWTCTQCCFESVHTELFWTCTHSAVLNMYTLCCFEHIHTVLLELVHTVLFWTCAHNAMNMRTQCCFGLAHAVLFWTCTHSTVLNMHTQSYNAVNMFMQCCFEMHFCNNVIYFMNKVHVISCKNWNMVPVCIVGIDSLWLMQFPHDSNAILCVGTPSLQLLE